MQPAAILNALASLSRIFFGLALNKWRFATLLDVLKALENLLYNYVLPSVCLFKFTQWAQITYTQYTLTNFHLPFADTCEPFQTHFLIHVKASEAISEGLIRQGPVESQFILGIKTCCFLIRLNESQQPRLKMKFILCSRRKKCFLINFVSRASRNRKITSCFQFPFNQVLSFCFIYRKKQNFICL
jgi:hypothetical protein